MTAKRCEQIVEDRSPHPHKLGREKRQCARDATMSVTPSSGPDVAKRLCRQHGEAALARRDLLGRPLWRRVVEHP